MITYVIWNTAKLSGIDLGNLQPTSYEGLLKAECLTSSNISSEATTNNIDELIESIYNEADVKLCFIEKPMTVKLSTRDWDILKANIPDNRGWDLLRIEKSIIDQTKG